MSGTMSSSVVSDIKQFMLQVDLTDVDRIEALMLSYTEVVNGERIVKEDVLFDSPSGAAGFCTGRSSNGWREWKDEEGNEITIYR